jgi:hypothetical protein
LLLIEHNGESFFGAPEVVLLSARINYMRANCVMPDPSDAALIAEWTAAKGKLGRPFSEAGRPAWNLWCLRMNPISNN